MSEDARSSIYLWVSTLVLFGAFWASFTSIYLMDFLTLGFGLPYPCCLSSVW